MSKLTHLDSSGQAHMVDVGDKPDSQRLGVAEAFVTMQPSTLDLIVQGGHPKGDVLAVARIAGVQAAKRTWELIPLCHPIMLTSVKVAIEPAGGDCLRVEARCKNNGQTGVEMEALTAASVAALTLYDMCKAVDRGISVDKLRLVKKAGGKSGDWERDD
ncbi:cyclic pyranopterin monophosphate synthase MoaC [bacterium SCSIO 12696]|nr:cyclic pyranopterin monophosphate synthase MoaC [bacterium SCSIO 12696]